MYLFYTPDIAEHHFLSAEESVHAVRVLRHAVGDKILLTDGRGSTYEARIVSAHPKHTEYEIISQNTLQNLRPYRLHIAIAPTKNIERLEWAVEKCTEIGVDEITPILCRYSERKTVNEERLERIVFSACKQSLKACFPQLHPLTPLHDFLHRYEADQRFIAHCYKDQKQELSQAIRKGGSAILLIGPEGDFSEQEVAEALELGYQAVSLGNERLRVETAAVVGVHTVSLMNSL